MTQVLLPSTEQPGVLLARHLGVPGRRGLVSGITELTPGLSGARVFRVHLSSDNRRDTPLVDRALPSSVIVKVPDAGNHTGIAPQDPQVATREVNFYESGVVERLPAGVRPPRLIGVDRFNGTSGGARQGTLLWTEDVADALSVRWEPPLLFKAARHVAALQHVFRESEPNLLALPWLERDGHAAHAHFVPAAHQRLDRMGAHPRWGWIFTSKERQELHQALDLAAWAAKELRRLPQTFVHGDFHILNLGIESLGAPHGGALVAIDWAHAGIGPLGADVATLINQYATMGGDGDMRPGSELERDTLEMYCAAVAQSAPHTGFSEGGLRATVRRAAGLWHLTWGLHLRLGPGLDWLLRRPDQDADAAAADAEGIRDGCVRALAFMQGAV